MFDKLSRFIHRHDNDAPRPRQQATSSSTANPQHTPQQGPPRTPGSGTSSAVEASVRRAAVAATSHNEPGAPSTSTQAKGWIWDRDGDRPLSKTAKAPVWVRNFLSEHAKDALKTGIMVEAGFDNGSGVRAFKESGWTEIHAIDKDERCLPMIETEMEEGVVHAQIAPIQQAELPSNADVVHGHYLLPFLEDDMAPTLQRFFDATRSGGFLLCAVMGPEHSWGRRDGIRLYSESQIRGHLEAVGYKDISIQQRRMEDYPSEGGRKVPVWEDLIVTARKP